MYMVRSIPFNKFCIAFSWLFLYPYRVYGLKPVKRGCVVHCVTSKNNQKKPKGAILQMSIGLSYGRGPTLMVCEYFAGRHRPISPMVTSIKSSHSNTVWLLARLYIYSSFMLNIVSRWC